MAFHYQRGKYFWVSYSDGGQRIQRVLTSPDGRKVTDKKLAKYLTNELENIIARGQSPIPTKNVQASQVLKEFRQYSQGIKAPKTVSNTCGTLDYVIKEANFGSLKTVDERRVRAYLDERIADNEINHVTANNIIKYLNTFLSFGVKRNHISRNVIAGMKRYKVDEEVPRFLSLGEISAIMTAAEGEVQHLAIAVAIYTGLRLGELRRLKWADINMDKEVILVQKSKGGRARAIPIHSNLKKLLTAELFPLNFTNHLRVFKRIRKRAKLIDIGWHTFRHTFASHLIMSGVDIVTVSRLLGHSNIKTTMIYSHLSQDHMKDSIKKLSF